MKCENLEELVNDTSHWQGLPEPYCPNLFEVSVFKQQIGTQSPVYMLGMTKSLAAICDVAFDLKPIEIEIPTVCCNWFDMKGFKVGAIIGDGVLNLTGFELLDVLSPLCDIFICRVFTKKLPKMKYATFFPVDFHGSSSVITTQDGVSVVTWHFRHILTSSY